MQEPSTQSGLVRAYADPAYQPLCKTLADVRQNIDALDDQIVALIAQRAMYVKDAARFKRDAFQVSAPARQEEVFAKARALAQRHDRGFAHLDEVVDATYRAMVAAFIANEQRYFEKMVQVGDAA